jgi:tetratricopeptide (TPR) repeat protein
MNLFRVHRHFLKRVRRAGRLGGMGGVLFVFFLAVCPSLSAANLDQARELLRTGEYEKAAAAAREGMNSEPQESGWALIAARALSETGRYAEARKTLARASEHFPTDIQLCAALYEALRDSGADEAARNQPLDQASLIAGALQGSRSSAAPGARVAMGQVALWLGGDPKEVLERFFDPVKKERLEFRESWLASGELALEKNDFALASKTFAAAARQFPDDPDAWFGLARSYAPSDLEATLNALKNTLRFNPRHVGAQLLIADHHIDSENYREAEAALAAALKTNPWRPEAHAYRAVLAHLRADDKAEKEALAAAFKPWPTNPGVPYLIGRKLSQKYRFAEGAALQREALKIDPKFLPAKAQLANDLLRLGDNEQGWQLAREVQEADPYDVVAYNLTVLREAVAHFRTLASKHFTLRMDPREADVYGDAALALLERAHAALTKKYGLELRDQTVVEIFPAQKDFAIRTFGLPGGSGYLGVCFGRVITANSPASRPGAPSNWQSVLWHEFTHVVTLTLTKNKMPRWLSEGISVYEERQASGAWGEQMKPRYRAMMLGDDLTPVSQLSATFLKPKTVVHLGFAYYESSLVVEWLIERWGLEKMKRLLADLSRGVEINAALAIHFAPIEKLDAEFAARAVALAKGTGQKLDWTSPKPAEVASAQSMGEFIAQHPNNFAALNEQAKQFIDARKWLEAKAPLQKLIELYPDQRTPDGAYSQLARVQRELGETDAEIATLTRLADLSGDATEAFRRLMQLAAERKQWPKVVEYAARFQAVDPLQAEPYRREAEAREALGDRPGAAAAYRALLRLGAPDAPEIHYRLARLLHTAGDPTARREVILALEDAPRHRPALELLLEIVGKPSAGSRVQRNGP